MEPAEPETRAAAPDIIYLPDQSQPEPRPQRPKPGRHTGKMKGRHFGPRPVADPRSVRIDLRVTPAQRAGMKAAARDAGLSVSALICLRTLGTEGPRPQPRKSGPDGAVLTRLLAELGKSGSNLNQIARQLNAGEDADFPELSATLTDHRAAVAVVMCALGVPPDADKY